MAMLAEIEEVAGHSEVKTDAQLDELLSPELQQRLASSQDGLLDIEGEMIALFKVAILETRKSDDVAGIAAVWKSLAEVYSRKLSRVEGVLQEHQHNFEELKTNESLASLPAQLIHFAQKLKDLRDRAHELYELHA